MGDRGAGLVYSAGRLSASAIGTESPVEDGVRVLKVQAPVDNSDDARGGIGRMTPTTLLLHDEQGEFVHFVQVWLFQKLLVAMTHHTG